MGLKQCDKCEEMVDEAKAFCPGCGNAFVEEEKRQDVSKFEKMDNTVQMGQTMYNQMLSDMGLNISETPSPGEKRVEVITPIAPAVPASAPTASQPAASIPVKPAASAAHPSNTPGPSAVTAPKETVPTASRAWIKWVILAVILLILLAVFLIIAAAVAIMYLPQLT